MVWGIEQTICDCPLLFVHTCSMDMAMGHFDMTTVSLIPAQLNMSQAVQLPIFWLTNWKLKNRRFEGNKQTRLAVVMKIKITSEVTTYIKTSTWHQDDYSSARWSCSSYCHGIPQKGWWSWIKWEHIIGNHENEKRKGAGFSDWYILYTKNIFIKLTWGIISHFEVTLMDNIRRAVWETKQHRNENKPTNSVG